MAHKIIAATDMRQNLREVLEKAAQGGIVYYITQRSTPRAVLTSHEEYEELSGTASRAEELKAALRWSLGFIANISAAMEGADNPAAYISLLEAGVRQGLQRGHVPRGVLTNLGDAEAIIREWDHKTFRTQQEIRVLETAKDSLVLGRQSCPPIFETMRQAASFHIRRIGWRDFRGAAKAAVSDFLCLCCSLCGNVLVDWLSDGRFLVAEIPQGNGQRGKGVCAYAIRPKFPEKKGKAG